MDGLPQTTTGWLCLPLSKDRTMSSLNTQLALSGSIFNVPCK